MNVIADHLADHAKSPILIICQVKGKRQTKDEKDVRKFLEMLNYIARFISQLTMTCDPIFDC